MAQKNMAEILAAITKLDERTKTLDTAPKVQVAEIVQHGEKLILPAGLPLKGAIDLIKRRMEYEDQETVVLSSFDVYPWDGAYLLNLALKSKYGWASAIPTPGFFGSTPPKLVEIQIGPGQVVSVPWGRFSLPNVEGWLETGAEEKNGQMVFKLIASVKRRDESVVQALYATIRGLAQTDSIYRGKAIRISFVDEEGEMDNMAQPTFLDTDAVDPERLILSDHLHQAVNTNLFTPITRTADCLANGISVKRGVLLGGTFGTGKTMCAHVASKLAVQHGITFLYIAKAEELPYAIEFARQYQSPACVIFCEDIDREMDGKRDADMDQILNTIDGIDSKTSNIIVVLTTNNIEGIHPAMLRPGRLDAVIDVTPPDAKAIERLIRAYAGRSVAEGTSLARVGEVLAGNIPAVIAEVVKRAKLAQLARQERGTFVKELSEDALLEAAKTIQAQVELLRPKVPVVSNRLGDVVEDIVQGAVGEAVRPVHDIVKRLKSNVLNS